MARTASKTKGRVGRLIVLGIALGIAAPYVKDYVEGYMMRLMVNAIHYHWQWEQSLNIYKPALETEKM